MALGKLKLLKIRNVGFGFRLVPIFASTSGASKNEARYTKWSKMAQK
jgi:hypothetical protein